MTATGLIAVAAVVLSTVCWLPQVWKTLRTRAVRDLSLWSNGLILLTMSLWLIYGMLVGDWPLIVANAFSSACVGTIVAAKLLWGRQ